MPATTGAAPTILAHVRPPTVTVGHPPYVGWQKWIHGRLADRRNAMTNGMQATLDRIKASLER